MLAAECRFGGRAAEKEFNFRSRKDADSKRDLVAGECLPASVSFGQTEQPNLSGRLPAQSQTATFDRFKAETGIAACSTVLATNDPALRSIPRAWVTLSRVTVIGEEQITKLT